MNPQKDTTITFSFDSYREIRESPESVLLRGFGALCRRGVGKDSGLPLPRLQETKEGPCSQFILLVSFYSEGSFHVRRIQKFILE